MWNNFTDLMFRLYDVNHDGCITRQEMLEVITAIYSLMGETKDTSNRTPQQHVEKIFRVCFDIIFYG